MDLKLANKTFRNIVRNNPPRTITALVCSVACLKRLLSYMNRDKFRDRLRTVIVEDKRRFPAEICAYNRWHLFQAADQSIRELAEQCGDAIKAEGFVASVWSGLDMAAWSVEEWNSVVPLKVQKDLLWRQKN